MIVLWVALFTLVVSDGMVTNYLTAHGFAREWNPLLVNLVGNIGFLLVKAFGAMLAIFLLWDISKRHYRLAFVVSYCFVLLYGAIVFWNIFVYFMTGS